MVEGVVMPTNTKPWYVGFGGGTSAAQFAKTEASRFARDLLNSEEYRSSLRERIKNKTLSPAVEVMLWHYGYGKPPETVEITSHVGDISQMTPDQQRDLAEQAVQMLREADGVDMAIAELEHKQAPQQRIM